jgi:UDP-N-acetylglucosamine 2-epimerase (non-hydrolysing)
VAHVEAGIRSGDWTMPEEINRMVTDAITNWFFTTSEVANANLRKAGWATSGSSSSATR